jgi:acetolactate synthase I/II/III large subunit
LTIVAGNLRTGARILVDQFNVHGADTIFCVPGESYLAVLDALYDAPQIRVITARQEGGAAMMAEAYGKLTGRPGIVMVTRGPGACNASAGVHIAKQDSTPLILLIGQVRRDAAEREAFQEVDFRQMFAPLAKWVAQIEDAKRIPEFISRAFHQATNGRPGPVVLALPEDMLVETAEAADGAAYRQVEIYPGAPDMLAIRAALREAERPLIVLGGSRWSAEAVKQVESFAALNVLPVACVFRRQDRFDNAHPCYAGDVGLGVNPRLKQHIENADLLLAIGPRLGETTTGGYTLLDIPVPRQKLVHVHPDPDELGRVYRPFIAVQASPPAFAGALAELPPVRDPRWRALTKQAHTNYLAYVEPPRIPGTVQMGQIMVWLDAHVPYDTIFANGAGNFASWVNRFHCYRAFGTQLAPTSGSMGYGLPAAIAASILHPARLVICFTGDGDFLMTGQELATAAVEKIALIVILLNNNLYGTIRMHQEMQYPGRPIATNLTNPDFAALARAYGGVGEIVERTEDFAPAFIRAIAFPGITLIEIRIDPEAITPTRSLSELRAAALAKPASLD